MAFTYKRSVTIDHTQVPSTQTDFPFLINVTHADLKSVGNGGHVQSSSGFDIRPYSDAALTTTLTYELERYTATSGELVMWVKIPSLSSSSDTVIYLAYGDSGLTTDGSSSSTWDTNYKGVYHFKDAASDEGHGTTAGSSNVTDSTSNGNNGTVNNNLTIEAGQINGGVRNADNDSYVDLGNSSSIEITGSITVEVWGKSASSHDLRFQHAVSNLSGGTLNGWALDIASHLDATSPDKWQFECWNGGTQKHAYANTATTFGNWYHVVGTYDGTTGIVYVNGVAQTVTFTQASAIGTPGVNVWIARYPGGSDIHHFDGFLDEVRISNIARSANYVTTSYNNQVNPSSFSTLGTEQGAGNTSLTASDSLNNWADSAVVSSSAAPVFSDTLNNWADAINIGEYLNLSDNLSNWNDLMAFDNSIFTLKLVDNLNGTGGTGVIEYRTW